MSSVRTILASLFTVLGGFCLLALTTGAGFAIYIWTITDSVSAPAEAAAVVRPPLVRAESTSSVQSNVPSFAPIALAETPQAPAAKAQTSPVQAMPRDSTAPVRQIAPAQIESAESSSAMLTRAWAPAAMLVPTKDTNEPPARVVSDAAAPNFNRPNNVLASNDQTATEPQAASTPPNSPSPAYFEGGTPLAAAQTPDPQAAAPKPSAEDPTAQPVKTKKTKTTRRRPAKDDTVENTISKGFDSLQKSISSMF